MNKFKLEIIAMNNVSFRSKTGTAFTLSRE